MIKSNGNEMSDIMKEIIIDTLIDAVKLIPFLFLAFLIIELIEHKFNKLFLTNSLAFIFI